MKVTRYHIAALIVLAIDLIATPNTFANGSDTVQYRIRWSYLPDSTSILYEIGGIGLKRGSNFRYLRFNSDSNNYLSTLFRTESFITSGMSDTISLYRFADFDDKYSPGVIDIDEIDSQYAANLYNYYLQKEIAPSNAYFNSNSSVNYIVVIKNADLGNILAYLDTIQCYLNGSGKLRYRTVPSSFSYRGNIPLSVIDSGTPVYLDVLASAVFPPEVSWLTHTHSYANYQNAPNPLHKDIYRYQTEYPALSTPKISGNNDTKTDNSTVYDDNRCFNIKSVRSTVSMSNNIDIIIDALCNTTLTFRIISIHGTLISSEDIIINKGIQPIHKSLANLSSGTYIISLLESTTKVFSFMAQVTH